MAVEFGDKGPVERGRVGFDHVELRVARGETDGRAPMASATASAMASGRRMRHSDTIGELLPRIHDVDDVIRAAGGAAREQ